MDLRGWCIKREYAITKRLTRAQIRKIKKLRQQGLSFRSISKIVGVSSYTTYFHCLTDEEKVEFRNKVYHRDPPEKERLSQHLFQKRKQYLYKIGGLYKKGRKK